MKIHYRKGGNIWKTICGKDFYQQLRFLNFLTKDKKRITCKNCKRSLKQ